MQPLSIPNLIYALFGSLSSENDGRVFKLCLKWMVRYTISVKADEIENNRQQRCTWNRSQRFQTGTVFGAV